jgi:multiple sugar transport system permease protein
MKKESGSTNVQKNYNPENQPKAWLFLLPSLVIIFLFSVYPLFRSFIMSFQKGTLINQQYAGLENYQRVLTDPVFFRALQNTALFAFAVVPISLILSLAIAWIIFEKVKYKSFFETIFFMPYVTSTIAIGIVFRYFFNGSYGIINYLLGLVGIAPVNWLDNVNMSMTTLIIFGVWTSLAFNIIILLAGMRNIDKEHYKIAKMFGATDGEIFRKITFPQLIPTFAFLLTVNLISAFKVYTQVYALFGGQPGIARSATTAVFYIYDKFHIAGRPGIAMAATVILFIIILLVTFIQNKLLKKVGE